MLKLYQMLGNIDQELIKVLELEEAELIKHIIGFFKDVPELTKQRSKIIITDSDSEEAKEFYKSRLAKLKCIYLLDRLADLEQDHNDRVKVHSIIDKSISLLSKLLANTNKDAKDGVVINKNAFYEADPSIFGIRESKVEKKPSSNDIIFVSGK